MEICDSKCFYIAVILWSTWILADYAVVVVCFLAFVHMFRRQENNYFNSVLKTDFKDIENLTCPVKSLICG